MTRLRSLLLAFALCFVPASTAHAVVGGHAAPAGKYPYVAEIIIDDAFECTGTLVTPTTVITAGHCSSITGATGEGIPIGQPGLVFDVYLGSTNDLAGRRFGV